ncbi:ankyrin repeat-containing protein [Anaeramoeba ignava]|uniref:Ankyrin repeat-containing protein n=1 Tax=Anaeramoeba ignava TaxID=1746090 RepID=A0A9Q0REK1_ANAIG|nr:ankyrin repeat-containing protein [Anaeramoeba ignava]
MSFFLTNFNISFLIDDKVNQKKIIKGYFAKLLEQEIDSQKEIEFDLFTTRMIFNEQQIYFQMKKNLLSNLSEIFLNENQNENENENQNQNNKNIDQVIILIEDAFVMDKEMEQKIRNYSKDAKIFLIPLMFEKKEKIEENVTNINAYAYNNNNKNDENKKKNNYNDDNDEDDENSYDDFCDSNKEEYSDDDFDENDNNNNNQKVIETSNLYSNFPKDFIILQQTPCDVNDINLIFDSIDQCLSNFYQSKKNEWIKNFDSSMDEIIEKEIQQTQYPYVINSNQEIMNNELVINDIEKDLYSDLLEKSNLNVGKTENKSEAHKIVVISEDINLSNQLFVDLNRLMNKDEKYIPENDGVNLEIHVNNRSLQLTFWNIIQRSFSEYAKKIAYFHTDIFLLCFFLDNKQQFQNIKDKWNEEIISYSPASKKLLVGVYKESENMKIFDSNDDPQKIPIKEYLKLAIEIGASDFITLSLKNQGETLKISTSIYDILSRNFKQNQKNLYQKFIKEMNKTEEKTKLKKKTSTTWEKLLVKNPDWREFLTALENGIEINGYVEETPLHIACSKNYELKFVQLLILAGANVNSRNNFTPLHLTCFSANFELTELLLQNGAEINAQAIVGETPLQIVSTFHQNEKLIDLLLRYGANPSILNNKSSVDLAKEHHFSEKLITKLSQHF